MKRVCKDCGDDLNYDGPCEFCRLVDLAYPKGDGLLDMPKYGLVGPPTAAELRAIRMRKIKARKR